MQNAAEIAADAIDMPEPEYNGPIGKCEKHHRTFPRVVVIENVSYPRICPDCYAEDLERNRTIDAIARRAEQEKSKAKAKQAEFEARWNRAMIPTRYRDYKLSTFPVSTAGKNASEVLEGCRSYLNCWEQNRKAGKCLILVGQPGRGKTGLACSIGNAVIEDGDTAIFITAYGAVRHLRDTWGRKGRTETEALADLTKTDLLILDDVGAQLGNESEMTLLFEILNDRYSNCRPTILLSNLPVEDWPGNDKHPAVNGLRTFLGQRIMGRMESDGAMVLGCRWGNLRETPNA